MTELLKKLNILLRSSLAPTERRDSSLTPLSRHAEQDVNRLRQTINEALTYEDELKARLNSLDAEVARWDAEADRAVSVNDDVNARYAVEQMQRAQMRQTIAASDLRDHQLVTQELIQRVNMLDAAVADARRAESTEPQAPAPSLNDVLRDARDTISTLGNAIAAKDAVSPAPDVPVDTQTVDDDLETRRRRLSK
jgi:hypothetical protein